MVDPYDFVTSPSAIKSKQIRKKSLRKVPKKRKSNEKSRRASIRQTNSRFNKNQSIDMNEKENNSNNGFTQLIQTKMMEVEKKQGKRANKKVTIVTDDTRPQSRMEKRKRSVEYNSDAIPPSHEIESTTNDLPQTTANEHVTVAANKVTNHVLCESKDHNIGMANKRRRGCLCSKRQLDELEFAPDSIASQTQQHHEEEHNLQEISHIEPVLNPYNNSPLPLLLPSSSVIPPSNITCPLQPVQSVPRMEQEARDEEQSEEEETDEEEEEEEEEEDEEEHPLQVSSIMAAPLSPAMPLNCTYVAHRSIPMVTQIPSTLLTLSALIPQNTTITSQNITSPTVQNIHVEQLRSNHASLLPSIKSTTNKKNQETSMTPRVIETAKCTVSTQTNDDYCPTHHPCHDVSVCPCVQIYTRSEQLFMTSMAVFFRNSITLAPSEPSLIMNNSNNNSKSHPKKKNNKQQEINHSVSSTLINKPEIPRQVETLTENNNNIQINETYVVNDNISYDVVPMVENQSRATLLDTSTVINETYDEDKSKKSDGSSIQININARQELNEKSHEENSMMTYSNSREKFKSLVLVMTALKDSQKIEFNRFVEHFSVRSSTSVDETTTHLITDEESENSLKCPLTGKVLQAVARHLKIVSYRWLTACLTEQRYVDEIPAFEIIGDNIYKEHCGMSRSRLSYSNSHHLLRNHAFHLKCHGCQPFIDNRPLIELIHLSGGLILKTLNQHIESTGRQILILCSKQYLQNKPALQQACQKLKIICIEPEWLIASVVKFEIQPYEPWLCTLYS